MYSVYSKAEVSFSLGKEIGQEGRNSQAFIAHDENLDAEIVIKVIPKSYFEDPSAFFNESRLLYKAAHPHVVQIQYACACEENIYLALPYYSKGSLKAHAENHTLSVREIIRYGIQICSGIHNIHSKGLIHFDIKPDNILLSDRNEALISDFGLAKAMNKDLLATQTMMYFKHMAPEWYTAKNFNNQYDVYQIGLTLYRLLYGKDNFESQLAKYQSEDEFKADLISGTFPARATIEHSPSKLDKIINKCLSVDLNARYKSALDIANDLSSIDGNLLDWRYTTERGAKRWHKVTGTHEYMLDVAADGSSVGRKKTTSGNWTRIKDACGKLTAAKIKRFLGGT